MDVSTETWRSADCSNVAYGYGCKFTPGLTMPSCDCDFPECSTFREKCYRLAVVQNIDEAASVCPQYNAVEGSIHSDGENSLVSGMAINYGGFGFTVFLGIQNDNTWVDGTRVDYTNYANSPGSGQCKSMINGDRNIANGKWINSSCSSNQALTFCVKAASSSGTATTTIGFPIMAIAFIIDTRGGDPNLFAMTNETVNLFLQAYSSHEYIFLTDQQGNGTNTFVPNNAANIKQAFDVFARQRMALGDNNFTDLTPAFTAIQQAASSGNYNLQEMFFLTQTGVYKADISALDNLTSAVLHTVQYIATLPTAETDNIKTSIQNLLVAPNPGWDLSVANNTKDAVNYLVMGAPTPTAFTRAPIPSPRQYACVKKAQTSIFLSYETSNLNGTGIDGAVLNKTYFEFLQQFPSDFELGDTYNDTYYPSNTNDKDFCKVNTSRFDAQTLISGWAFSDQKLGTPNAMLCYNNFPGIRDYISMPSRAKSSFPNWSIVSAYINLTLPNPCKCSRLDDPKTLKAVVWLSFSEPDAVTFNYTEIITTLTQTNYVHIILAFGPAAIEGTNGFYHQLAQKSIDIAANYGYTDNSIEDFYLVADGMNTEDLVSFVYSTICKLQKIEGTTTPTGGNSEYFGNFWRQAELYPEMIRNDISGGKS